MSRLPALFVQVNDAVGAPVSGGKVYTYESGTTNLLTTYSDPSKAVANTNPVIAGADGIAGPLYMTDNTAYTLVHKDADDVTLRSEDGIYSVILSNDPSVTSSVSTSPLDYGAVGDGVADESSEVQQAINAAPAGGIVDLGGFIFRCDSQLTATQALTITNGTLDFSNCTDTEFIKVHGTLGSAITLSGNATADDALVSLSSVSGLSTGDLLYLYSTEKFVDSTGDALVRGEIVEIESFSTLDANVQAPLYDSYATASTASVKRISTIDDVKLTELRIIGAESISGDVTSISLSNCRRAKIQNVFIDTFDYCGVRLSGCYGADIESCNFQDGPTAILIEGSTTFANIEKCTAFGTEGLIKIGTSASPVDATSDGVPREIQVNGNSAVFGGTSVAQYAIHITRDAQFVSVTNNTIRAPTGAMTGGIFNEAPYTSFKNNYITNQSAGTHHGIYCQVEVPNRVRSDAYVTVHGNIIRTQDKAFSYEARAVTGGAGELRRLSVTDNYFEGDDAQLVLIALTAEGSTDHDTDTVHFCRNQVWDTSDVAGNVDIQSTSTTVQNVIISGNTCGSLFCKGAGAAGGTVQNVATSDNITTNIFIEGIVTYTSINDFTSGDFNLDDCVGKVSVTGAQCASGLLHVDPATFDPTHININGGIFDDMYIEVSNNADTESIVVNGAMFYTVGATDSLTIKFTAASAKCDNVAITNCVFNGSDVKDYAIYMFDSPASGTSNNVLISGNVFYHPSDHIEAIAINSPTLNCSITNNLLYGDGVATGIYILDAAANAVFISGNALYNYSTGIRVTPDTDFKISNNYFSSVTTNLHADIVTDDTKNREESIPLALGRAQDFDALGITDTLDSGDHYLVLGGDAVNLRGNSPGAGASDTQTDVSYYDFVIPYDYIDLQNITCRIAALYSADGDTKTLDLNAYRVDPDTGLVGGDLVSTGVQTLTATVADYDFTITSGFDRGEILRLKITTVFQDDDDGCIGEAVIKNISMLIPIVNDEETYIET